MNRKKVVPFAKKYLSTRSSPGLLLQSSAARTCVATMNTAANPRKLWMCPIWVMRLANGAVMVVAIDDMARLADTSTFTLHAEVAEPDVRQPLTDRAAGVLILIFIPSPPY